MHIVHGAWLPADTDEFLQDGAFYIWIESDGKHRQPDHSWHPRHLRGKELDYFLGDVLDLRSSSYQRFDRLAVGTYVTVPTASGAPLPSQELLPYTDTTLPEQVELQPWRILCFPLKTILPVLRDIHYVAQNDPQDFQLGADLLFWYRFADMVAGAISNDQWIPSLRYRDLGDGAYELQGGWEFLSATYDAALASYAAVMPGAARALSHAPDGALFEPETLLRHFAECMLDRAVRSTTLPAALERRLGGTILDKCFWPQRTIGQGDPALYRAWALWRHKLGEAETRSDLRLCFRLQEATAGDPDNWSLEFLVSSRRDPSYKVSLREYWAGSPEEQAAIRRQLAPDLERQVLLALGYAARIYSRVLEGMDTGQPEGFRLNRDETLIFLREYAPILEAAGFGVIVPAWWTPQGRRRARVRLRTSTRGTAESAKSYFSLDSVIEYRYQLAIDGQEITPEEWEQLVEAKTPLVHFRGQWMELDREHVEELLTLWEQRMQEQPELTLLDLLKTGAEDEDIEWEHEPELEAVLAGLQDKSALEPLREVPNFVGTLREYQQIGVAWLRYLEGLGLNPCLADDMGLGKTVQVIAQLAAERAECAVLPTLLIAPTSVLGNWQKEIARFAPRLTCLIHQGPDRIKDPAAFEAACQAVDVVITSFSLVRLDEKLLRRLEWQRVVVDEAQNIKNPKAAQTRAITRLHARHRMALTGTPVENRLRDLWSIFNFLNPGYLGKEAQFRRAFELPIQRGNDQERSSALRRLVEPFILRRLKTDPRIIADLPEKLEQNVYCNLTAEQASLYEAVVQDVSRQIEEREGMERRGLILATLTRLKQICNHPAHFLQDGSAFTAERSHKLERLGEMLDEIMEAGESVLIFTQFTEIGAQLERYISRTLHYPTYYLHGGTSAKQRDRMVTAFQDPESPPAVFVLSLRAGGTGLTLTKANHVFHFDRWWNPAVEDQATDRAFRIGQRKNVFAHKFVTLGTVEERIDQMIQEKRQLAQTIVGTDESWITELDNDTFRDLIALRREAIVE